MGVFYEYYRAADRETAVVQPEHPRVIADPSRGTPEFDVVETKWIDPHVILGQLVAFIGDVDFSVGLVDTVALYPPPEGAPQSDEEWDALPEDSPYLDGPGIAELPVNARDILAGADDSHLPAVAERWAKIEEFSHFTSVDVGYMLSLVEELVGLARRAKKDDQMLYCWMCV
ncbi:hypothetical protein ACFQVD_28030 [Streptosporangium amethystogenes subsp. fukuiense]|uniref:DUF1877 family protein n=1 Tax=Streptosporangium amethystogenes subsp. fukuiense TaxID=698418 RepID=A0ABW2T8E0_9ACTN